MTIPRPVDGYKSSNDQLPLRHGRRPTRTAHATSCGRASRDRRRRLRRPLPRGCNPNVDIRWPHLVWRGLRCGVNKVSGASTRMQSAGQDTSQRDRIPRTAYQSIVNAKNDVIGINEMPAQKSDRPAELAVDVYKDDEQKRAGADQGDRSDKAFERNSAVVIAAGAAITAGHVFYCVSDRRYSRLRRVCPDFAGPRNGLSSSRVVTACSWSTRNHRKHF